MKNVLFVVTFLFFLDAHAEGFPCFQAEYNHKTPKQLFKDEMQYKVLKQAWESIEPEPVNSWNIFQAEKTYNQFKQKTEKTGKNIYAACFLSCQITLKTNYETAKYFAWLTEYQNLIDCDKSTVFSEKTYLSSMRGALFALLSPSEKGCHKHCRDIID